MAEFDFISRYFSSLHRDDPQLVRGVGDDAAVLDMRSSEQLVSSVDTLVAGIHFPPQTPPDAVAQRVLMSNLSDIAAMGATPRWCLLSLVLPQSLAAAEQWALTSQRSDSWLAQFSRQLGQLLKRHKLSLIGGDTTAGTELSLSMTVLGVVARGQALLRNTARVGDDLYVSGFLGEAAWGLQEYQRRANTETRTQQRFLYPQARLELGEQLRPLASSCIDVSDGLLADAGHIAAQSGCRLVIEAERLLCSKALSEACTSPAQRLQLMLTGGDDYELCFTAAKAQRRTITALEGRLQLPLTRIGEVVSAGREATTAVCVDASGALIDFKRKGYQHFATD